MTKPSHDERVEEMLLEFRKLLEDAHVNIYTDGVPMFSWLRTTLTSLIASVEADVRADEAERIKKIIAERDEAGEVKMKMPTEDQEDGLEYDHGHDSAIEQSQLQAQEFMDGV